MEQAIKNIFADIDCRTVIRNQNFVFKKAIMTQQNKITFLANIEEVITTKNGNKLLKSEIIVGEKCFMVDTLIAILKEDIHNSNYKED